METFLPPHPSIALSLLSASQLNAPTPTPTNPARLPPRASIPVPESLPASNFPQTRPAPSQARPGRRPLPLPSPRAGSPCSGGTHAPAKRTPLVPRCSPPRGPASPMPRPRVDRPAARLSGGRIRSAAPASALHSHAPYARSPSAATRPRRAAPAFTRRPAAGPPPGHRVASALRLAGSRPPRHILTLLPPPFLPAAVQASRGGGSRLGSAASPAPGPAVAAAE